MFVPLGLLVMLLSDDETGETIGQVECHFQLLQHLHVYLLLMTNQQADTLFGTGTYNYRSTVMFD